MPIHAKPFDTALARWNSLSETTREWLTKIAVALAIAIAWHFYIARATQVVPQQRETTTPSDTKKFKKHRGVRRESLDPLPDDLVLEERLASDGADIHTQHNDSDESKSPVNRGQMGEDSPQDTEGTNAISRAQHSEGQAVTNTLTTSSPRPPFTNSSRAHPGLEPFWQWCDVECSLFRVYNLGVKSGGLYSIPPFIPRSRRGNVKISLRVGNRTDRTILVYWLNYKGHEDLKGRIRPNSHWTQQTWVEHPWVFRDEKSGDLLLHYVPERLIPTKLDENDPSIGVHQFTFHNALVDSPYLVRIEDPVFPFPAQDYIKTVDNAVDFSLDHMRRTEYGCWDVLVKYLTNILQDPANGKFRQIRIANPVFFQALWQTPARGLLLALGFVEQGAYAEWGTARPLTRDQTKMLSTVLLLISTARGANARDAAKHPTFATPSESSLAQCRVLLWPQSASDIAGFVLGWRVGCHSELGHPSIAVVAGILDSASLELPPTKRSMNVYDRLESLRKITKSAEPSGTNVSLHTLWQSLEVLAWYDPESPYGNADHIAWNQQDDSIQALLPTIGGRCGNLANHTPFVTGWGDLAGACRQVIYYDDSGRTCYQGIQEQILSSGFTNHVLECVSTGNAVMALMRGDCAYPVDTTEAPVRSANDTLDFLPIQLICASIFLGYAWRWCNRQDGLPFQSIFAWCRLSSGTGGRHRGEGSRTRARLSPRIALQQSVTYWDEKLRALVNIALGLLLLVLFKNALFGHETDQITEPVIRYVRWQSQLIQDGTEWLENFPVGFKLNEPLTRNLGHGIRSLVSLHEFVVLRVLHALQCLFSPPCWYALLASVAIGTGAVGLFALWIDAVRLLHAHIRFLSLVFWKIFQWELFLLAVMWRVFRGKKLNILRKRTDSMQYDSIQLLLGSILFAVALFLFTTFLVYHLFFMACILVVRTGLSLSHAPILWLESWPAGILATRILHGKWYAKRIYLAEEDSPLDWLSVTTLHSQTDGISTLLLDFLKTFTTQVLTLWIKDDFYLVPSS